MQNHKPSRKKSLPSPSTPEVKLPKIPKIKMPDDFKIRTRPLFSLPEEVLKLPPPTTKATKMQGGKSRPKRKSSGKKYALLKYCTYIITTCARDFVRVV